MYDKRELIEPNRMQPGLFEAPAETVTIEQVILYALGDFQSRGKVLVNRELAFDRLRGAFLRAFARFGMEEPADDHVADKMRTLGIKVAEIPSFVAKHPYRVSTPAAVSENARRIFTSLNDKASNPLNRDNI